MNTITNITERARDKVAAWLVAYFMGLVDLLNELGEVDAADWLEADIRAQHAMYNRGQSGTGGLASLFIGLMIAAIIALRVFIPVVNDAIASSNLNGTEKTIVELLPLFAALLLLIALAAPLMRRSG